jgi:hypothetical protein
MRLYAEPINDTPGIPSVILTVNRVDQFLSNTGSFSGSFNGNFTGSLLGTSSNSVSSSYALTSSLPLLGVTTASATNTTITFTKGDGTTFDVTVSQSGSVATASYALFAEQALSSSYAGTASVLLGSVVSSSYADTASIATSASYAATASYVVNALTASYVVTAQTASYVLNAVSSSFASTSSIAISSSYALTASFALNGGGGAAFPFTGSAVITGSLNVIGLISGSSISSSIISIGGAATANTTATIYSKGTGTNALYTKNSAGTERFIVGDDGLVTINSINTIAGTTYINGYGPRCYRLQANPGFGNSSVDLQSTLDLRSQDGTLGLRVNDAYTGIADAVAIGQTAAPSASAMLQVDSTTKGMLAPRMTTSQRNAIASPARGLLVYDTDLLSLYQYNGTSWVAVGGGSAFPFTGSAVITGSLVVTGSITSTNGFTGSLLGTSSWADNSISSSYALTASFALNGGGGAAFPFTGNALISGSLTVQGSGSVLFLVSGSQGQLFSIADSGSDSNLFAVSSGSLTILSIDNTKKINISGSLVVTGSITGSLLGTASFATNTLSASYAATSSIATSSSYALTASFALNGGGGTSNTKAGSGSVASFTGTPLISAITFVSAFADNNYSVTVTGEDARIFTIQSKSNTGFTINTNSNTALTGPVYWIANPFA